MNRPGIHQIGKVTDNGVELRVTGWGLNSCATGCPCHRSPATGALAIYENQALGLLGLVQYRRCSCCEPWTAEELAAVTLAPCSPSRWRDAVAHGPALPVPGQPQAGHDGGDAVVVVAHHTATLMPWSSSRPKTNTTERGYGSAHQAERKRRLPRYTEHDPCGRCGRPLGPDRRRWHLPHSEDRTHYLPGFWCAPCNWQDGAQRGARIANRRRGQARHVTPLRW